MQNKFCLALILLLFSNFTFALQVKPVTDNRKIIASIANDALNRIAVVDDRISQVFGLEDDFFMETDEKSGQIFIRPKEKKVINLTVITEKHLTIDVELLVDKVQAETILLKPTPANVLTETQFSNTEHTNRVSSLILAMARNQPISGFATNDTNKEIILWENINIAQSKEYIGKELTGEIYNITNNTEQGICLTETHFGLEKDTVGVALTKHTLAPKEVSLLYIVRHSV